MPRLRSAIVMIGCLLSPAAVHAAAVTISGDAPRESITVAIENEKVDTVLKELRKRYGFELAGVENATRGEALSTTLNGSLHGVVERLLRNRNYLIVRSPDNASGIAKVMILNATYGAAPQSKAKGRASSDTADQMMQALTGSNNPF